MGSSAGEARCRFDGTATVNLRRTWVTLLLAFMCTLAFPRAAQAEPYELFARLRLKGDPKEVIDLPVAQGVVIPRGAEDYTLDGIYFKPKADDVSKTSLARIGWIDFVIERHQVKSITKRVQAPLDKEIRLAAMEELSQPQSVENLTIQVHAFLKSEVLCTEEINYRRANFDKSMKDAAKTFRTYLPAAKGGGAAEGELTDEQMRAAAILSAYPLRSGPSLLVYSFCKEARDVVDWKLVAGKNGKESTETEATAAREDQKNTLAALLLPFIKKEWNVDNLDRRSSEEGKREYVGTVDTYRVSFAKELAEELDMFPGRLSETEETKPLGEIVDQESQLYLALRANFCKHPVIACGDLISRHLVVTAEGKDQNGAQVKHTPALKTQGDRAEIKLDLREFLGEKVTLSVYMKIGDKQVLIKHRSVRVENLGFVTSFPVVSEVVSFYKSSQDEAWNPQDIEYSSSLPISWAYNVNGSDGRHVAITLPFMMGINPAAAPRLSNYFRIYVHMSAILPLAQEANSGTDSDSNPPAKDEGKPQLSFGAGISTLRAICFGWGVTTGTGSHFFMLGLSPPDLAKLDQL